jgi:hypothetical protein
VAYRFDAEKYEVGKREREEARLRESLAAMDAAPDSVGFCYFFGGDEGPIKIGYSRNLAHRINTLKSNTGPIKARLLARINGGREREAYYHGLFKAHRLGNEWFERCPEIQAEIDRINATTLRRISRVRGCLSAKQGCGGLRGVGFRENVGRAN